MLERVLTVNAALLLLGSSAIAQGGPARACTAACIKAFCGELQPGQGRIHDLCQRALQGPLQAMSGSPGNNRRERESVCG
jgi:hypothetical protein